MTKRNGGPAFPVPSYVNLGGKTCESQPQGMTLRDYFAAKVMAVAFEGLIHEGVDDVAKGREIIAKVSYKVADAMIAERDEPCG